MIINVTKKRPCAEVMCDAKLAEWKDPTVSQGFKVRRLS